MKPADDPDFFTLPPPAGRSRESRIRLDFAGRFWDGAERVEHAGMVRAFASWIARHPDGRFILNNGYDWTYFTVEDVPFFVTGLRRTPMGWLLTLSDGSEEALLGPLWEGAQGALYTKVKAGAFDARFSQQLQAGLGEHLVELAGGWGLQSGDVLLPILSRAGGGQRSSQSTT
jgi:uncharacterized protein